jgi:hypothetical protein
MEIIKDILGQESIDILELNRYFPDITKLKDTKEINRHHNFEDVYTHTLKTLEKVYYLVELNWTNNETVNMYLKHYLSKKIDNFTRLEILKISTILHDFAKYDTFDFDQYGFSICPNHEFRSLEYLEKYSGKLQLSETELEFCKLIIQYHAHPDFLCNKTDYMNPKNRSQKINILFGTVREVWVELILLALADTMANQLLKNDSILYHKQIDFYIRMLIIPDSFEHF